MTVNELIEKLRRYPGHIQVVYDDSGYDRFFSVTDTKQDAVYPVRGEKLIFLEDFSNDTEARPVAVIILTTAL